MTDSKSHHSNQSYQAGLNGGSPIGKDRDAYVFGQMANAQLERDRAAAAKRQQASFGKSPSFSTSTSYAGDGSAAGGIASLIAHGFLIALAAIAAFVYFAFTEIVSTAILGAGIIAVAIVLGLIGLPVFKLVEVATAGELRTSLPRAYLRMVLAYLAFGLAAALTHALFFGIMFLTGHGLYMLALLPGYAPISTVVYATGYLFANAPLPAAMSSALTPFNIGLTAAVEAIPGLVAGAAILRRRDRPRFGGFVGFLRAIFVLVVPFGIVFAGLVALAFYLASIGFR